jgi:hypothetical protein
MGRRAVRQDKWQEGKQFFFWGLFGIVHRELMKAAAR